MISPAEILKQAYNAGVMEEFMRLEHPVGKAEFHQVTSAILPFLKKESTIVDVGCGPGRYAEYFIKHGHQVGCVDMAEKPMALLPDRLQAAEKQKLLFHEVCCASQLQWMDDQLADIILLMGPMYHLTDASSRQAVFQQCQRILRPGGHLFVMYLNAHHSSLNPVNHCPTQDMGRQVTTTRFQGFDVPQYRLSPEEALLEAALFFKPLQQLAIVEGSSYPYQPKLREASQYLVHYQHGGCSN